MSDTSILVSPGDRLTIVLPEHVITCQVLHTRPRACASCSGESVVAADPTTQACWAPGDGPPPGTPPVTGVCMPTDGGRYPEESVPTPTIVVKPLTEVDRNGGQSPIIRQG